MTDVVRTAHLTPRPRRQRSRWGFWISVIAAVAVSAGTVTIPSRPASASKLSTARARAAQLYAQVQAINNQVGMLGQRFDAAQNRLASINSLISHSEAAVARAQAAVANDQVSLRQDALNAYINANYNAATNPLFNTKAGSIGAAKVYNDIAEGNVQASVSALKISTIELTTQRQILAAEKQQAAAAERDAQTSFHNALALQAKAQHMLNQARGQVAYYLRQAEAAAAAACDAACKKAMGNKNHWPMPPVNSRAYKAIAFALSMLGVPYVWGGASRHGVDCSGLVMLAWHAAGVSLPHYSGAQMANTVRIPPYAMKAGDLLFYGRGGSEHVAMYIGHGMMIEAPTFGQRVHITSVRMGYNFAGVGRVR